MENLIDINTQFWLLSAPAYLTAIGTFLIAFVAWKELSRLLKEVKLNSLSAVLQIESEINARRSELDSIQTKIQEIHVTLPDDDSTQVAQLISIYNAERGKAKERLFNALDRLCFCIRKGYISDKDWRSEYRNLLQNSIKNSPDFFGPGSPFNNILALNTQWQEE